MSTLSPPKGTLKGMRSAREKALALTLLVVAGGFALFLATRKAEVSTAASTAATATAPADPPTGELAHPRRVLPAIGTDRPPAQTRVAESMAPTHAAGPKCEACSTENCTPATDGCDGISDSADRALCEDLYDCFADPASACTIQGDPVRCWCGTHLTTCLDNATGPLAGNGPCRDKLVAAAKTSDPRLIRERFVDAKFPLGRAVNLTSCRGSFCTGECQIK